MDRLLAQLPQQMLNGIFAGSIYALFAIGYTLVFGVLDILNLAHHAVFTAAAFVCLTLVLRLGLPALAALLLVPRAGSRLARLEATPALR
jgi:branched-chain amino acid transport system permease protein